MAPYREPIKMDLGNAMCTANSKHTNIVTITTLAKVRKTLVKLVQFNGKIVIFLAKALLS